MVLLLQDTTEFAYRRVSTTAIGVTRSVNSGRDAEGRWRHHTLRGLLLHTSLAATGDGVPLGPTAVKVRTRSEFKGTAALKRTAVPTRVPIEGKESVRWLDSLRRSVESLGDPGRLVHVADRESNIYELSCLARDLGTHFVVRTCVDRLAGDGGRTVAAEMAQARARGLRRVELRGAEGEAVHAVLEVRARRVHLLQPVGKQRRHPALDPTVLHVTERNPPRGREPIEWKLLTDLPVRSRREAVEKTRWYAMRWKVETFHKILKSGCRAEESCLRSAERIADLLALFCIVARRILWLTLAHRADPTAAPRTALRDREISLLDRLAPGPEVREPDRATLALYIGKLAPRRPPRPLAGPAARHHRPLARAVAPRRHRTRGGDRGAIALWVIESQTGRLRPSAAGASRCRCRATARDFERLPEAGEAMMRAAMARIMFQ